MANEKRLIDVSKWESFYQERKQSLEVYNPYDDGYEDALDHVDDWMDAQSTVDAVEVVRCKDCKHYNVYRLECHNGCMNGVIQVNGFCFYGERKDNGKE